MSTWRRLTTSLGGGVKTCFGSTLSIWDSKNGFRLQTVYNLKKLNRWITTLIRLTFSKKIDFFFRSDFWRIGIVWRMPTTHIKSNFGNYFNHSTATNCYTLPGIASLLTVNSVSRVDQMKESNDWKRLRLIYTTKTSSLSRFFHSSSHWNQKLPKTRTFSHLLASVPNAFPFLIGFDWLSRGERHSISKPEIQVIALHFEPVWRLSQNTCSSWLNKSKIHLHRLVIVFVSTGSKSKSAFKAWKIPESPTKQAIFFLKFLLKRCWKK